MVKIENVSFERSGKMILNKISLNIEKGEVYGLVGPNGAGKTTLLDIIAGVKKATDGSIVNKERTGYLFQFPERNIFAETVFEEIAFWGRNLNMDNIADRVKKSMQLLQMDFNEFYARSPFLLSYGEKRKVSIASILIGEPSIVLLDEPDAGLSESSKMDVINMILNLKKKGVSFIVVSHNLYFLSKVTDKINILYEGCVKFSGNIKDCLDLCKNYHYKIPFKYELLSKFPEIVSNLRGA